MRLTNAQTSALAYKMDRAHSKKQEAEEKRILSLPKVKAKAREWERAIRKIPKNVREEIHWRDYSFQGLCKLAARKYKRTFRDFDHYAAKNKITLASIDATSLNDLRKRLGLSIPKTQK